MRSCDQTINKSPKLYPLIVMRTRRVENIKGEVITQRSIVRNKKFDSRWYTSLLPRLYARQIAKYDAWHRKTHNGRPLMELPYSVNDIYINDEVEAEYIKWDKWVNAGSNWKSGIKTNHSINGEEILQNELEE